MNSKVYAALLSRLPLGIIFKYTNAGNMKQQRDPPIPPQRLSTKLIPLPCIDIDKDAVTTSKTIVRSVCSLQGSSSLFLPIVSFDTEYLNIINLTGIVIIRFIQKIT